jgi:hypothetical protein
LKILRLVAERAMAARARRWICSVVVFMAEDWRYNVGLA